MMGIVGTSGSGKSTLMNILGGLDRPSAGCVSVDGIDLLCLSEEALNQYQRCKVGFVWQQTGRNLIPYLTAQENIELPMSMAWLTSRRMRREWSDELLNAVELYDRRHHKLTQLSGGEQQRVAIAVGLANKPVLLLGDEPTGEVDSVTSQKIMETFHRLTQQMDLTTIIVTHDPRIATQVDRVVAIRDGKISTETIRQVSQLEKEMVGEKHVDQPQDKQIEMTFQEYVVLDSAGRLQIPKELRDELGINKRAFLEKGDDCITIRPTGQESEEGIKRLTLEEQIALLFEQEAVPASKPGSVKALKRLIRK
jgi:ABC-type lipoprotein export system ATPase subunit/bifunctional DNA-binding transcriptional regulator/antitoxin component of YhaV-PrlF toxin-antitoxin module